MGDNRLRLLVGVNIFWLPLSMCADGVNTLVLPLLLLPLVADDSKATALGVLSFGALLLGAVVQPVAGAWSDSVRLRWPRQHLMAAGVAGMSLGLAALGVASSLLGLLLGYLVLQVSASIAQAAQQGLMPDAVPSHLRGMASGLKGLMDIGGSLAGFLLLGRWLGSSSGASTALLAIAIALFAGWLLALALIRGPTREDSGGRLHGPGLREAFRLDLRRPAHSLFAWLVVARFFFLLSAFAVGRFLLYFVADRLLLDPARAAEEAGGLLAGLTLITVIASLPAGWLADRWGRVLVMAMGAGLSAVGVLLLANARSGTQILLLGGCMSLGSAAFSSANWAAVADLSPPQEGARFFALANLGTAGATAFAGLLGLPVDWANRVTPGSGYSALFVIAALVFVLSALALLPIARGASGPGRPIRIHVPYD